MFINIKIEAKDKIRTTMKRIIRKHNSLADEMSVNTELASAAQVKEFFEEVFFKNPVDCMDITKMDIAFLVPYPIKGSGGHRNIYRAIQYLHKKGYHLTVYYCGTYERADIVKNHVTEWFYDMTDIPFVCYAGKLAYHDVMIATWWLTVYYLKQNLEKIKYPMYFVQDYESSFYPTSSKYVLAENTYRMGFSCICSGKWMGNYLTRHYGADAESFQFPVNRDIYWCKDEKAVSKEKKRLVFFAKPEMPRRCYEIGILALREFNQLCPNVEIVLYGSPELRENEIPFHVICKKLVPTLEDLAELYRSADLGLVFSTTNPSLVPYEMMACGCPIVDIDMDMALDKYGGDENNVFLLSPEPKEMGRKLADIIKDEDLLALHRKNGIKWVKNEFPSEDEMGERVMEMIINKVKYGKVLLR